MQNRYYCTAKQALLHDKTGSFANQYCCFDNEKVVRMRMKVFVLSCKNEDSVAQYYPISTQYSVYKQFIVAHKCWRYLQINR